MEYRKRNCGGVGVCLSCTMNEAQRLHTVAESLRDIARELRDAKHDGPGGASGSDQGR